MVERVRFQKDQETEDAAKAMKDLTRIDGRPVEFIHTGSTRLNLAASGRPDGGWARGRVVNIVGDGSTGKTLLALEICAYVLKHMVGHISKYFPKVKRVKVFYNNAEKVMDFDLDAMYPQPKGKPTFRKLITWAEDEGVDSTVEAFAKHFLQKVAEHKSGDLIIYIVDSFDAIDSEADIKFFEKSMVSKKSDASEKDEESSAKGTYYLAKQKYMGQLFKKLCARALGKDITLIIISQVRAKIGVRFGKKTYRAGGKALDFYTHQVVWLADMGKMPKKILGTNVVLGIKVKAKVERNKTYKPYREAEFPIVFDYGIDDITSMLDWLYGPECKEYEFEGMLFKHKRVLIKHIEANDLEHVLVEQTTAKWQEVEDKARPNRKPKY